MNIILDWTVQPAPQNPTMGPSPVIVWAMTGNRGPVAATAGNQVQTIGVIGQQDDRMMFDTPTGLV